MNNDSLIRQVRYLKRVLGEAPRNIDSQIIIDAETEADVRDSLNRMEETLTNQLHDQPRN